MFWSWAVFLRRARLYCLPFHKMRPRLGTRISSPFARTNFCCTCCITRPWRLLVWKNKCHFSGFSYGRCPTRKTSSATFVRLSPSSLVHEMTHLFHIQTHLKKILSLKRRLKKNVAQFSWVVEFIINISRAKAKT